MSASLRVLIIEDLPDDAEFVARELRNGGYDVAYERVDTAAALRAALDRQAWDIIISDYTMPRFSGWAALEVYKEKGLDLPFVIVSGAIGEDMAVAMMKAGASDYIMKDNLARLAPAIERELRETQMRRGRKQAEKALQESEWRFRALIERAVDVILVLNRDGTIRYASPSAERVMGYRSDELEGRDPFVAIAPESQFKASDIFNAILQHPGLSPSAQVPARHKDGSPRILEGTAQNLLDDPTVEGIIVNFRDITERKRAEEEIRQLNASLERRAKELTALNTAGRALSSTLDLNALLELVISQVKSLLGVEAASVLLRDSFSDELVFAATTGSAGLVGARMPITAGIAGWVMAEGRPALVADTQSDPRFYNRIDASTGLTTRSLLAVPLMHKGTSLGVVEAVNRRSGTFDQHDLEVLEALASSAAIAIENARLYQAEREALRRLQESQTQLVQVEKMAALGRLVASIAHEINNPLQAVQGSLELAAEEIASGLRPDKLTRYVNVASIEIERLADIVQRMRDFYRPAREGMQPTDVNALAQNVLELAGKQLQHSRITVVREWADALPTIQANPNYLKQVFLNLVLNAIDAIGEQGGTLRVRTALDQMSGRDHQLLPAVRVEFSDTGEGIPPELLPRIFEPFVTTKKTGTGLGLSISYRLIEAHNGQIAVTSETGVGTTFTILLPVTQ